MNTPRATTRVLTGITTSGTPHLGNYVGAIRPAVQASRNAGTESFYFLADYHALIKTEDPARVQRSTLEIAASWVAAGLDPERVTFYRQSDVPKSPNSPGFSPASPARACSTALTPTKRWWTKTPLLAQMSMPT
jgi:tryptophanyl-tRNA synthetase